VLQEHKVLQAEQQEVKVLLELTVLQVPQELAPRVLQAQLEVPVVLLE
jgi:hypothetical protein